MTRARDALRAPESRDARRCRARARCAQRNAAVARALQCAAQPSIASWLRVVQLLARTARSSADVWRVRLPRPIPRLHLPGEQHPGGADGTGLAGGCALAPPN